MNRIKFATLALALLAVMAGCQTPPPPTSALDEQKAEITLREGDVIRITFPAAPNLDTQPQPIRRDGKITVSPAGEVTAAGLTPTQLQDELISLLGSQLLSKQIIVSVVSSTFEVYVDGPVARPGKITSDKPITIMEAIMESGGFDYTKANTKKVMVIRHKPQSKDYTYYTVNLQDVLDGKQRDLFYLAPGDMVHVTEKFNWF
jgi:protein involved in polysaccharide export with SLBB domain